jgi:ABC-type lipoprotein export system ATPase subunit
MNDPRGSIWRKWDLHVHTPASHNYKGTFDELIENLKSSEATVIGINDYCTIDGYNEILERGGVDGKVLFPVVEFRMHNIIANRKGIPKEGGVEINFHVIFNNNTEVFKRVQNWLKSLTCYNSKGDKDQLANIPKPDLKKITFDFDTVIASLDKIKLRKEALIWLPYDEYGGIDDIDPNDNFFKLGLIRKADIIGSSTEKQIAFFLWKHPKFTEKQYQEWFDKPLPCIKGSDAHNSRYPVGRLQDKDSKPTERYCGIKADTTFEGLKQACVEPEARVFIGKTPWKVLQVDQNKDKYIDKIFVSTTKQENEWFDNVGEIPLNTGLVAIIGNKGSGKSALADMITLAGNCHKPHFSFLNERKFLELPVHKKYSVTVNFLDNFTHTCCFVTSKADLNKDEKVVYLSQSFVNQLCDTKGGIDQLQNEIDRVVFSHIPEEEKLGQRTLKQLIVKKTKSILDLVDEEIVKLKGVNTEIVELEEQSKSDYRLKIQNKKSELERQLDHIKQKEKPDKVEKPSAETNKTLTDRIDKYSDWLNSLNDKLSLDQDALNSTLMEISNLDDILAGFERLKRQFDELKEQFNSNELLKANKIKWDEIVSLDIKTDKIMNIIEKLNKDSDNLKKRINKIENLKKKIEDSINRTQGKLGSEQKKYQIYLRKKQEWEKKQKELIGDQVTENTIEYFKARLHFIANELFPKLVTLYKRRKSVSRKILENIFERKRILESIYRHAQDEAKKQANFYNIPITEFIEFNSNIEISSDFDSNFFAFINQNRTGTFYRIEDGEEQLNKIKNAIKKNDIESLLSYPDRLIDALNHNISVDPLKLKPECRTSLEDQLLKPKLELYNYLFSFQYLTNLFTITYDGRNIPLLSPGEKGILLLIFYLLIDKDNRPIIIDQPEENLDNETVFLRLVSFIREIKKKRQIIIVTHNPNLAIVCDSEQIIYAYMDKNNNNLISYISGGIENKEIKNFALKILEGTKPAFNNRKEKYSI